MRCESLVGHKAVENGGHEEVCDASSSVAKATSQGIGGANNVLIEEARRPDLTWDKATSQDPNKETNSHETACTRDRTGQCCGYGTYEKATSERPSWSKSIATGPGNKANQQAGNTVSDYDAHAVVVILT